MKKILTLTLVVIFIFTCVFPPNTAIAEDSAAGKASKELLGSLANVIGDAAKIQNMPEKERVKYILTTAKKRLWEQTEKSSIALFKQKTTEYAKRKLTEDLFKRKVTNMLMDCVVNDKNLSAAWDKTKTEIASELDTKLNVIGKVLDTAEVGYKVYKEWSEKGPEAGLKKLSGEVIDKVMEYAVPGWGYYKIAQSLVIALGEYVLAYSFDTAFQTKLDILMPYKPVKGQSKQYAQWLLNTDITSYVTREWNEQLAYSGWYAKFDGDDKTKETGGDAMLKALIAHLEGLKAELKKKEQIKKDLENRISALEEDTKKADREVRAITANALKEIGPYLAKIEEFERNYYGFKKKDAEKQAQAAEREFERELQRALKDATIKYTPIDKGTILSYLEAAGDEIKETGNEGYDQAVTKERYEEYLKIRKRIIQDSTDDIREKEKSASEKYKKRYAEYKAQYEAKKAEEKNITHGDKRAQLARLEQELQAINDAWIAARAPYSHAAHRGLSRDQKNDLQVLRNKETVLIYEMLERANVKNIAIQEFMEKAIENVTDAYGTFSRELTGVRAEIKDRMHFSDLWRVPGWGYVQKLKVEVSNTAYQPGEFDRRLSELKLVRKKLEEDAKAAKDIYKKEKASYEKYFGVVTNVRKRYMEIVPEGIRFIRGAAKDGQSISGTYAVNGFYSFASGKPLPEASPGISIGWSSVGSSMEMWMEKIKEYPVDVKAGISEIDRQIAKMKPLVEADREMVAFGYIRRKITKNRYILEGFYQSIGKEKGKAAGLFFRREGKEYYILDPEKSDGAVYLENLEKGWEENKKRVEQLESLKRSIGDLVSYGGSIKKNAFASLKTYKATPERIKMYQELLEAANKDYQKRLAISRNTLDQLAKKLKEIETATSMSLRKKKKGLKSIKKQIDKNISLFASGEDSGESSDELLAEWKKFDEDVEALEGVLTKGGTGSGSTAVVVGAGEDNFQIRDPRVNTRNIQNVRGILALTDDDMLTNDISITAKLPYLESFERILISVDGGNKWEELPLSSKISYKFIPIPDVTYRVLLKIRTDMGEEAVLIFKNKSSVAFGKNQLPDIPLLHLFLPLERYNKDPAILHHLVYEIVDINYYYPGI